MKKKIIKKKENKQVVEIHIYIHQVSDIKVAPSSGGGTCPHLGKYNCPDIGNYNYPTAQGTPGISCN